MTAPERLPESKPEEERCERCGMATLEWRRCKLVCANCGTIVKSCADL